jgi:hypothetical protein
VANCTRSGLGRLGMCWIGHPEGSHISAQSANRKLTHYQKSGLATSPCRARPARRRALRRAPPPWVVARALPFFGIRERTACRLDTLVEGSPRVSRPPAANRAAGRGTPQQVVGEKCGSGSVSGLGVMRPRASTGDRRCQAGFPGVIGTTVGLNFRIAGGLNPKRVLQRQPRPSPVPAHSHSQRH